MVEDDVEFHVEVEEQVNAMNAPDEAEEALSKKTVTKLSQAIAALCFEANSRTSVLSGAIRVFLQKVFVPQVTAAMSKQDYSINKELCKKWEMRENVTNVTAATLQNPTRHTIGYLTGTNPFVRCGSRSSECGVFFYLYSPAFLLCDSVTGLHHSFMML